jgi:photosystem II stability/assembly factor-like uncharacterized protein
MPKFFDLTCASLRVLFVFSSAYLGAADYDPTTADAELLDPNIAKLALFTDITATDTGAVAVGERGHILKSSNLSDWVQLPVPTRSLLTNVYAKGPNVWAVGHEELILRSSDGGSSWTRQHVNAEALGPLLDVIFLDENRGFAIGAEGKMLRTTDGGANWIDGNITDRLNAAKPAVAVAAEEDLGLASDDIGVDETPPHLNAIVQNQQGLMIVGESGAVYRSIDQAETWTRIELPYNGPLFGAIVLSNDSVLAYGLNGNAFLTSDLGSTWQKLETGTEATLLGAVAVAGGRAVIVGSRGVVLTKDADSNVLKAFTFGDGGVLGGVLQRGDTEFVVVGENGILTYSPK